jgi:hypothetical protein
MPDPEEIPNQTYSPWSVVNLVFHHLAEQGLQPTLGEGGDPGVPAGQLLSCLGIQPVASGDQRQVVQGRQLLADLRAAVFDEPPDHRSGP